MLTVCRSSTVIQKWSAKAIKQSEHPSLRFHPGVISKTRSASCQMISERIYPFWVGKYTLIFRKEWCLNEFICSDLTHFFNDTLKKMDVKIKYTNLLQQTFDTNASVNSNSRQGTSPVFGCSNKSAYWTSFLKHLFAG